MTALEMVSIFGDYSVIVVSGVLWWHVAKCEQRSAKWWKKLNWLTKAITIIATKQNIVLPDEPE